MVHRRLEAVGVGILAGEAEGVLCPPEDAEVGEEEPAVGGLAEEHPLAYGLSAPSGIAPEIELLYWL